MDDSYLDRDGARIAYRLDGSGPPACYAHGVPMSREAVRRLDLFDFDALARDHRLLTYDARGHGRSTGRPVVDDYRFETFTADLLALLDAAGVDEPVDFAGSSLGCDTALRAAVAAPDRFRRLVLMIPPAGWDADAQQAKRWYFETADVIDAKGVDGWIAGLAGAEPMPLFADYPKFPGPPDVPEALLPSVLRGVGGSDLPDPEAVAALDHPALILAWTTDALHPVATAQRLRELMPNATLHLATSVADVKTWTTRITDFLAP